MVIHQGHSTSAAVNRCYHISATFQYCAKLELLLVVIVWGEEKPDKQKSPVKYIQPKTQTFEEKSYCNFKFHYSQPHQNTQVRYFHQIKPSRTIKRNLCSFIVIEAAIVIYKLLFIPDIDSFSIYVVHVALLHWGRNRLIFFHLFFFSWDYSKLVMVILSFVKPTWDYCGEPFTGAKQWCFQRQDVQDAVACCDGGGLK